TIGTLAVPGVVVIVTIAPTAVVIIAVMISIPIVTAVPIAPTIIVVIIVVGPTAMISPIAVIAIRIAHAAREQQRDKCQRNKLFHKSSIFLCRCQPVDAGGTHCIQPAPTGVPVTEC